MGNANFDFVIVGSGGGGLAAAITAKLAGLRPLLIEKTPLVGGSSAMSGGVLWLPASPVMKREGVADSRDAGLQYMENFVEKGALYSTPARREAYLDAIAPMIATMESQGMKYKWCYEYSDYYDLLPGGHPRGRAVVAELFDVNSLGSWAQRLRPGHQIIPIHTMEAAVITQMGVNAAGKMMAARIGGRMIADKLTGRKRSGGGNALQGRMLEIALRLGIDIWTEAALVDVDIRNGRVEGVHINHEGRQMTVAAPRGVLITAGGFAHNAEMRQQYQRQPSTNEWTHSNPGDTGEAIQIMTRAGAGLALMEHAWWNSTWFGPNGKEHFVLEFSRPHGIVVGADGKRFVNEANSYMELGEAMYERNKTTPAVPAWIVMDARFRKKYFWGMHPPGKMSQEWIDGGWVKQDATIAGLAHKCGIDAVGLEATVARYNSFCETGDDKDFGRGKSAYNRYFADPTMKPNPCLGTIAEGPFWAAPIYPGDVGTCGGVLANERAEVMRPDGSVIDGLFAAGNSAASLCGPYYVAPGQSVGASSIFGFIAAKQAAH